MGSQAFLVGSGFFFTSIGVFRWAVGVFNGQFMVVVVLEEVMVEEEVVGGWFVKRMNLIRKAFVSLKKCKNKNKKTYLGLNDGLYHCSALFFCCSLCSCCCFGGHCSCVCD